MNENIKLLLEKVAKDEALQAKFKEVKNPDEAYELAASIQDGFTKEEFITTMKEIKSKMSKDISDEDLGKAAGGSNITGGCVTMMATGSKPTMSVIPTAATAAI
jgi:predicted ribosomally synthesized peptide with nif11-like leader